MRSGFYFALLASVLTPPLVAGQDTKAPPGASATRLKDEIRMPWSRNNERFIRRWLVLGEIPAGGSRSLSADSGAARPTDGLDVDWLEEHGGETRILPTDGMAHKLPDGSTVKWRQVASWGDVTDLSNGRGLKRDLIGYAFAVVKRPSDGKALLSIGSDEGIRAWANGELVLDRRARRSLTPDEDQVEVEMRQGDNSLLVKLEQRSGPWIFCARVLESGAVLPRVQEIGPSVLESGTDYLTVKTDISEERASQDRVTLQVVAAGGRVVGERTAARGSAVRLDTRGWADGAYEVRCTTRRLNGLLYTIHLPWYKGDAIAAATELVAAGTKADPRTAEGFTIKMLADLVVDRLGPDFGRLSGNPWWAVHSPLMEFEEIRQEGGGGPGRVRPYGFVRLAYRDEVDGSIQSCRAYLPGGYDRSKKWPVVLQLHGYNPENPEYIRWWSVDMRHAISDVEFPGHQGIIYIQPHGRGNTSYLGMGDRDVVRVIRMAKERFSVDEERVYLTGDSMGGWGTWNVASRHPDLFAAIAPVFGGSDYHSQLQEEALARLTPLERLDSEKQSSFAMAEGLLHMPILVLHGDADQTVTVEHSRYGVRLLQRWGYNVRYHEYPGLGHEDLNAMYDIVEWFLQHRRVLNPSRIRLRTAELQNASAYGVRIEQREDPAAFMVVDAEVAGPNVIRLDTQNVLAMTLSPGPALADTRKPAQVVWNGSSATVPFESGRLRLRAAGYEPARGEKDYRVAGPISDVLSTPFAVVIGTASADSAMNEMCRLKAQSFVDFWKTWQHHPPRVFVDSELSNEDAARYSLILFGGAEANLVTRRLARDLLVAVKGGQVTIGGRPIHAPDACAQVVGPNPLNRERYVLVLAGTSADGFFFWRPDDLRSGNFDFVIKDGRVPAAGDRVAAEKLFVAAGWFDHRWAIRDSSFYPGDPSVRSKCLLLRPLRPKDALDASVYGACAGGYELAPGTTVHIALERGRLTASVANQPAVELIPITASEFYVLEGGVHVTFVKDEGGKIVALKGFQKGQPFYAKRID